MKYLRNSVITVFCSLSFLLSSTSSFSQVKDLGTVDYINYYDFDVYNLSAIDNLEEGTRALIFKSSNPKDKGRFIIIDKLGKEGGFYQALEHFLLSSKYDIDINIFSEVEGAFYQLYPESENLLECTVKFYYHKDKTSGIPIFRIEINAYSSTFGQTIRHPTDIFLIKGIRRVEYMLSQLE